MDSGHKQVTIHMSIIFQDIIDRLYIVVWKCGSAPARSFLSQSISGHRNVPVHVVCSGKLHDGLDKLHLPEFFNQVDQHLLLTPSFKENIGRSGLNI